MLKQDRQREILNKLKTDGTISIREISNELSCSSETIRRELTEMEEMGLLHRVHGGAYIDSFQNQIPVSKRREFLVKEKNKIAIMALEKYIQEPMTIALDDSTTCLSLAREIVNADLHATLFTNSLGIMKLFEKDLKNTKLIGIGGSYRASSNSFVGYESENFIKSHFCDITFLSCPSMGMESGLMHNVSEQCSIDRLFIERSKVCVLLMDHSKFKNSIRFLVSDYENIDAVITDKKPSDEWVKFLQEKKVDLIYPEN